MTREDLKTCGDFIPEFVAAVWNARKEGKTADDIANTWKVPGKFDGYLAPEAASVKNAAQVVMDEIKSSVDLARASRLAMAPLRESNPWSEPRLIGPALSPSGFPKRAEWVGNPCAVTRYLSAP
jgi:hypothetical protein